MAGPIITLLTDFGASDSYVAEVKGVILTVNPSATLVDITHEVPPQDIAAGAFLLGSAVRAFPPGTVHLAVVDPGVGTERAPLLLVTPVGLFVGPDNGLFTLVLGDAPVEGDHAGACETPREGYAAPLPPPAEGFRLTEAGYWRQPVSPTFHARDLFGPVAAHLTLGVAPAAMGRPVERATRLAWPRMAEGQGTLGGQVVHVDRFGNLVTNIPAERALGATDIRVAGEAIPGLSRAYQPGRRLVAVAGGHGLLEIAVPGGSAAASLGAGRGAAVTVFLG